MLSSWQLIANRDRGAIFGLRGPNAELPTGPETRGGSEFTGLRPQQYECCSSKRFSQIGTRQKNIQYPARNDNSVVKTSYSSCFEKLKNSLL